MPLNEVPGESAELLRRRAAARRRLDRIRRARQDEPAAVLEAITVGIERQEIARLLGITTQTVRVRRREAEAARKAQGTAGQGGDSPSVRPVGDGEETGESPGARGDRAPVGGAPSPGTGTSELPGSEPGTAR